MKDIGDVDNNQPIIGIELGRRFGKTDFASYIMRKAVQLVLAGESVTVVNIDGSYSEIKVVDKEKEWEDG